MLSSNPEIGQPVELITWRCPICGEPCSYRKIATPRNWIAAMAHQHQYSVWSHMGRCPRAFEQWHRHAEHLTRELGRTSSQRLRALIDQDLVEHLQDNGIDIAAFEQRLQAASELEKENRP